MCYRLLVILLALVALFTPLGVQAATSVTVVITATPGANGGISGFTVEYIGHAQLDLSWGFFGDAVKIMIRSKYGGGYPDDIPDENTAPSDGNLVYYGNGVAFSDTSMDFDENPGTIYYKVWAQKADGKWYTGADTGEQEGETMIFLTLALIALGLTVALFWKREPMLGFAAVIFWLVFGAYSMSLSVSTWDVYYAAGFGSILGMTILCGAGAFQFYKGSKRGRSAEDTDFIDEEDKSRYIGETRREASQAERGDTDDTMFDDMPRDSEIERRSRPSARTMELHVRAQRRKTGIIRQKTPWGEFK